MINKAIELLKNDQIIGMPTETVYGLAGSIYSREALLKIFKIKERPFFDPLIVHVASIEEAKELTLSWPKSADILAKKFWPGPLTLVLQKSARVDDLITSGFSTVGIRMPNHPMALDLIKNFGSPLAAPSANKFKKTSPTSAEHVHSEFQEELFVLDGGNCAVGIESTILSLNENEDGVAIDVLRKGHIKISEIEHELKKCGLKISTSSLANQGTFPGQMKQHYMPKKPLVILKKSKTLKDIKTPFRTYDELTLSIDPIIAARELYSNLRSLGQKEGDIIIFRQMNWNDNESWEAISDRLYKAASEIC